VKRTAAIIAIVSCIIEEQYVEFGEAYATKRLVDLAIVPAPPSITKLSKLLPCMNSNTFPPKAVFLSLNVLICACKVRIWSSNPIHSLSVSRMCVVSSWFSMTFFLCVCENRLLLEKQQEWLLVDIVWASWASEEE